jgi:hypothetical protein
MSSSGVYIAVYCLLVLAMLLVAGYGYWAWRGYRRALREALLRRHERDVELGERVEQPNYWRRTDPHSLPDVAQAVPVALQPLDYKATEVTYSAGVQTQL